MPIRVFWLRRTEFVSVWLRRYRSGREQLCPKGDGKYDHCEGAKVILHEKAPEAEWGEWKVSEHDYGDGKPRSYFHTFDHLIPDDDARWPTTCERCGLVFEADTIKQLWAEHLYRNDFNEDLCTLRTAPPGAMWDAWWYPRKRPWIGADGLSVIVMLPNRREWAVDSRASNCTLPDDDEHYCWVRHGDAENNEAHVDKNGKTCQAGAGSIQAGDYHGFLHNNHLT